MIREKRTKRRILLAVLVITTAAMMLWGEQMAMPTDVSAASKVTLKSTKISGGGDWTERFSGGGYKGLCAKANYKVYSSKEYTLHNPDNYCKNHIMQKLAYYYGYKKGWTSGANGCKLARAFNYVSTQSGNANKGEAYHWSGTTLKNMVKTAENVKVPSGFVCYFAIPTGNTKWQSAVIWKYTPPGTVTVAKRSAVSGYNPSFAGCEYTLYKSNKTTVAGTLKCGENGKTNTLTVDPGTYYAKETKTNANYQLSGTWYTCKVESNKLTKLSVTDKAAGAVQIRKLFTPDSDDQYSPGGFAFTLINTANSSIKYSGKTDANGKLEFKNMPPGSYKISEILSNGQMEDGYVVEDVQGRIIKVVNNKTTDITWTNSYHRDRYLIVSKTTDDGSDVAGFHFDIRADVPAREMTGEELLSQARITKEKVKEGFSLGEFEVDPGDLDALNSAAENKETGEFTVHVTGEAENAAEDPEGYPPDHFKNQDGCYAFAKGDVLIYEDVKYAAQKDGVYTEEEMIGTEENETIVENEDAFREYEAETQSESVSIPVKVTLKSVLDEENVGNPVQKSIEEPEGWKFRYRDFEWAGSADVFHKNDDETTTTSKGSFEVRDIPHGVYTVTEELTPEQEKHYTAPEPMVKTIAEEDTGRTAFSFEMNNKAKWTDVTLRKTDTGEDGIVEGIEFTLSGTRSFDDKQIEPVTASTDEQGNIDFGKLYAGSYVVEETGFDRENYIFHKEYRLEGHDNPAKAFTVSGEEEKPIEIEFENDRLQKLYLTKVDKDTREFLPGAVFDLYENGAKAVTFTIERDEEGRAAARIQWKSEDTDIAADTAEADPSGEDTEEDHSEEAAEYNYAVLKGVRKGAEYRIVETAAPEGYAVSIDYPFTFKGDTEPLVLENAAPGIGTKAADKNTGMNMSDAGNGTVTIIDRVSYWNLQPGKEYVMSGRLVYKPEINEETGEGSEDTEPVKVNGKPVSRTVAFKPEKASGNVNVALTFDAAAAAGKKTVVFEELIDPQMPEDQKVIATHTDAGDEGQSIYFPSLHTTASDSETEKRISNADREMTITDSVNYSNVVAGRIYEITGTVMDKSTGKALLAGGETVSSTVRFKAAAEGPLYETEGQRLTADSSDTVELVSGTVDLSFVLDGTEHAGKDLVIFEKLSTDGKQVGRHADINEAKQTVSLPRIGTKASSNGKGTITDKVAYENLIAGENYIIRGVLMNKDTGGPLIVDGKEVTSELRFTPAKSKGTVKLEFSLDASEMKGRTLVAFETCYILKEDAETSAITEVEVGSHRDLNDRNQTVSFKNVQTGQNIPWTVFFVNLGLLAAAGYGLRRLMRG